MDFLALAALITAVTGAVAGIGGLVVAARRDSLASRTTAHDIATRAAEAAVGALQAALDRQDGELRELRSGTESLETLIAHLRGEVERCHRERDQGKAEAKATIRALTEQIHDAELVRDRALRRISELESKVATLEAKS